MIRNHVGFLSLAALLFIGGCGRVLTEGVAVIKGPEGVAVMIQPVSPQRGDVTLEDYSQFRMEPFTDDFGRTPQTLLSSLPGDFTKALADHKIHNRPGGRTLVIRGRIIHYEPATGMTKEVFGPFEEVIARVELVDEENHKVLGVANCIGRSDATYTEGVRNKAQGLAKGIAAWIADHYPKR